MFPANAFEQYEAFTSLKAHQGWTSINRFSADLKHLATDWSASNDSDWSHLKKTPCADFDGQTRLSTGKDEVPHFFFQAFFPVRDDVSQFLGNYHKEERNKYFEVMSKYSWGGFQFVSKFQRSFFWCVFSIIFTYFYLILDQKPGQARFGEKEQIEAATASAKSAGEPDPTTSTERWEASPNSTQK